jgi:hypothetical protein
VPNSYPCRISKERILASYEVYGARLGPDSGRSDDLGIDLERVKARDPDELWKLWVLANLFQRVKETVSEKRFVELMSDPASSYLFSPSTIDQMASACACPYLRSPRSVHQCDYKNKSDTCAYPQYKDPCVLKRVSRSLARHPSYYRIAATLVASSLFLRRYEYDFNQIREEMVQGRDGSRLLQILKDISGLKQGQKVPIMFLAWLSNPIEYGIWDLDYFDFIPIDLNVRRVAERANACRDDQAVKTYVQELATHWDLNVREVELAFLNVGQEYCQKTKPLCHTCPFGPRYRGGDKLSRPVRVIRLKDITGGGGIETEAEWHQIRDQLDRRVKQALADGNKVEII